MIISRWNIIRNNIHETQWNKCVECFTFINCKRKNCCTTTSINQKYKTKDYKNPICFFNFNFHMIMCLFIRFSYDKCGLRLRSPYITFSLHLPIILIFQIQIIKTSKVNNFYFKNKHFFLFNIPFYKHRATLHAKHSSDSDLLSLSFFLRFFL